MRFPRPARRAGLIALPLSWAVTALVAAAPAMAQDTPNGQNGSTDPISSVATILLFVGIPLTVMTLVALVAVPSRAVGALRYRPGRAWGFDREWFGAVPPGAGGPSSGPAVSTDTPALTPGGASATW